MALHGWNEHRHREEKQAVHSYLYEFHKSADALDATACPTLNACIARSGSEAQARPAGLAGKIKLVLSCSVRAYPDDCD